MLEAAQKRAELRRAVSDLRERGLYQYASWAAEQLSGLPEASPEPTSDTQRRHSSVETTSTSLQDEVDDVFLLGKSYFDLKDYLRAGRVLSGVQQLKAVFLRCYALYLAGERRKEEERVEEAGPLGSGDVVNPQLEEVECVLRQLYDSGSGDAFCSYLYGLVLVDRENKTKATSVLLDSLHSYPCNWGAWQALQLLVSDLSSLHSLSLPRHWMRDFFVTHACLELQEPSKALDRLQVLARAFPRSDWVALRAAQAQYDLRNFDEAQELFEDLLERDPYRVEGMDSYSNILYVKEQFPKLSHLAHRLAVTDKYKPETCCVIGNYYSLKGQHEKAVLYFRRALKLNPHYLSAWTLMGHEYLEMKNPSAAIEAYRHAVDLNPRDVRAWNGLGQTYELVQMPYYALYYYRRAAQLCPHDARFWCAMGQCYENEQLSLQDHAIRCYRRAVANGDREGIALHKLAKLHEALGERGEAAHYYQLNLDRIRAEGLSGSDQTEALQFLAQYYKDDGQLAKAEELCTQLLDFGQQHKERAKQLLREILESRQHGPSFDTPARPPGTPSSPGSDLDISPMS